jgi:uncharacterized membrane protein YjfL (UPF0719 family)
MFEELKSGNSSLRIRRIAISLMAVSIVLFIATYALYQQSTSVDDYELWERPGPNAVEMGLAWGALLGAVIACGMLAWSFIRRRPSEK